MGDDADADVQGIQLSVQASNMVSIRTTRYRSQSRIIQSYLKVAATHRLVDLVTEIKLSQVTSNLEETNDLIGKRVTHVIVAFMDELLIFAMAEARSNMYAARKNEAKAKLDKLRAELDDASAELEFHYMNSRCR